MKKKEQRLYIKDLQAWNQEMVKNINSSGEMSQHYIWIQIILLSMHRALKQLIIQVDNFVQ